MEDITNVHPGAALREFLEDYALTQSGLAREIRVSPRRISAIVRGERSITADTAVRLAQYFGNRPDFWLGLQELYDIREAEDRLADELTMIHPLATAG